MLTRIILCLLLCSGASGDCNSGLSITAPERMEALSGSCLQIPCKFTPDDKQGAPFNSEKPISVIWGKSHPYFHTGQYYVVFNSSNPKNKYDMNITGSLRDKDCTTVVKNLRTDYTDQYYFRIESGLYKATAVCDPLHITVKDDPWSPVINVTGEQKERETVTVTCSAVTPCPRSPPKLTWNAPQDSPNIRETNTDGTFTTKIQYSLTLSEQHDGLQIRCSAVYPVNRGNKMAASNITLSVKFSVAVVTWKAAVGGSVGLLILICLALSVWCFISKRGTPKESEREADTAAAVEENREDVLHYGQIDFCRLKSPKVCPGPEPEETVYSQVTVGAAAPEHLDDLYAQVKTK